MESTDIPGRARRPHAARAGAGSFASARTMAESVSRRGPDSRPKARASSSACRCPGVGSGAPSRPRPSKKWPTPTPSAAATAASRQQAGAGLVLVRLLGADPEQGGQLVLRQAELEPASAQAGGDVAVDLAEARPGGGGGGGHGALRGGGPLCSY